MYRPSDDEIEQYDTKSAMYIAIPNPEKVLNEFDGVVSKLEQLGIEVMILDGKDYAQKTSNMIYLRDVAFVYKSDIILARMKHGIRENEPQKFLNLIHEQHPSLLSHIKKIDRGTIEGADLLINTEDEILAYTGSRTSKSAIGALEERYTNTNFRNIQANIDGVPQHLLGGIHIIDTGLYTRRVKYCSAEIEKFSCIDFNEDDETSRGFSLNILTIGPSEILMPRNREMTKTTLEAHGITCHEVEMNEIHKMGGGLACMVLPICRA